MPHYAHSVEGKPPERWQRLVEHLRGTAAGARVRGTKFGAGNAAEVAGLLHDLGKYSVEFQRRLTGATERPDHATAGARELLGLIHPNEARLAEAIAQAIAGHHSGMPDRRGDGPTLDARLDKELPELDAVWREEIGALPASLLPEGLKVRKDRAGFQLGMFGRFVFSCLVDADFRDTEDFYAEVRGEAVERGSDTALADLRDRLDTYLASLRKTDTDLNRLRGDILEHVRGKAGEAPGLFSLTVPTGGGKTLASLAFALDHAIAHGLDRVIYAIPFTSIIDQTAKVFREALGKDVVLEHHSAIDSARMRGDEGESSAQAKLRRGTEDWDFPVVVTTNVQLFESLFSNRPSRCRKLHNIARSVVVLDEAQTIPRHVLRPCVAAIDELARNYRTSVVLCTATQPALETPDFTGGLERVCELAQDPPELQRRLRRTTIRHAGEMIDADLVAALADHPQSLVIVNSRAHALALYRAAKAAGLDGLVHLSTRMTAYDRGPLLGEIKGRLQGRQPCRVISTSLVEAGVDLDFPAVWRAEAGLDSVLQAAGRCNREGRHSAEASIVTIFNTPEYRTPSEIAGLAGDMERVLRAHDDLTSLEAIADFFGEVYWRAGERLDRERVLEAFRFDRDTTDFAYRTVAEGFRLIEEGMAPVIVPRDADSRNAVKALGYVEKPGGLARRLQGHIVQVPPRARAGLIDAGQVRFVAQDRFGDRFAVLTDDTLYTAETGLVWEEAGELRPESSVM